MQIPVRHAPIDKIQGRSRQCWNCAIDPVVEKIPSVDVDCSKKEKKKETTSATTCTHNRVNRVNALISGGSDPEIPLL